MVKLFAIILALVLLTSVGCTNINAFPADNENLGTKVCLSAVDCDRKPFEFGLGDPIYLQSVDTKFKPTIRCEEGFSDLFGTWTDVYIIPASVLVGPLPEGKENRISLPDFSHGAPNTIQGTFSGALPDNQFIGFADNVNKYSIVFDECQDGFLDIGEDSVFTNAFTVSPFSPSSAERTNLINTIRAMKIQSGIDAEKLKKENKWIGVVLDLIASAEGKGNKFLKAFRKQFGYHDIITFTKNRLFNQFLHLDAIHKDPARSDYFQPNLIVPQEKIGGNSDLSLLSKMATLGNLYSDDSAILESVLSANERFQGALAADDFTGMLIQLQSLSNLLNLSVMHISSINKASSDIIDELPTFGSKLLQESIEWEAFRNRVSQSGFNETELRIIKNLGLSDTDIEILKNDIEIDNLSELSIQDTLDSIKAVISGNNDRITTYRSTQNVFQNVLDNISSFTIAMNPTIKLGGPYFGVKDVPLSLNGSSFKSEISKIESINWDLDGDGAFDDATGMSPVHTYKNAIDGIIGVKAMDESGNSGVAYTQLTITDPNSPPVIDGFTPNTDLILTEPSNITTFTLSSSDNDNDPVEVTWLVDGQPNGTGNLFEFQAMDTDILTNKTISAVVTDGKHSEADAIHEWRVITLDHDMDKDLWRHNVDCNDSNPNINPGMKEIFYNGADDDCNPASIDTNSPPIANNQTLEIVQFSTADIILTGNDVDGYPLNFTITKQPENGTLSNITIVDPINARLTYSPTSNFHGEDIFGFTVNDGNYTSNPASVNITVLIQDPPVAQDQILNIDEDTTKDIFLASSSPDGHQLNFSIVSKSNGGKLSNISTVNATSAEVKFTPFQDFNSNTTGDYSFLFKVNDGIDPSRRGESQASVQITINPINDPPRSFDRVMRTQEDAPINITLRASDAENDFNLNDHHNHGLNFSLIKLPVHGTVGQIKHNATGSNTDLGINSTDDWVTYTPNTGFVGQDQFTFKAGDGKLNGNESVVMVQVNALNTSLPREFEAGDLLIPDIDEIQWRNPDGTLNGLLQPITAGTGRIQKGGAFDSSGNLYITEYNGGIVSKFNKTGGLVGPFGDYIKDYECVPNSNNGSPICEFWPLSITFDKKGNAYISGQVFGSTNDAMDDIRKFDPDGNLIQKFDADIENVEQGIHWIELGPDQCTLYYTTATDHIKRFDVCTDKQLSDYADLFNDPLYDRRFDHQPILVIRLLPNGEILVAQNAIIQHLDTSGKIKKTYDKLSGSANWISLALDPDNESFWAGAVTGTVYKFDIESGKVLQFFNLLKDNPFAPPTAAGLIIKGEPKPGATNIAPSVDNQTVIANINEPISVNLTGSDISKDPLTFSLVSKPSFGTLGPITKITNDTSKVIYTPNQNSDSADSFTFNANDGFQNSSNVGEINILMNNPPLASDDLVNTIEGNNTNIPILANDTDVDNDPLTITSVNTSSVLGDVTVNNGNGTITYVPLPTFSGNVLFNYTVSDGRGANDSAQVRVNIKSLNDPPIANNQNVTTSKNVPINITLSGSDPNGDSLIFSQFSKPTYGFISKFNTTTGILQYTPLSHFHGNDSLSFRVSDGKTKSIPAIVNITVTDNGVNDPPNAISERTSTERNKPVIIDVLSNDNDPNGDPLTIANITGPVNGTTVVNQNETITFVPLRNFNGSDFFIYNVTDGKGGSDIAQVIVDVRGPSGNSPTVQDQSLSTNKNAPLNITLIGTSPSGSILTFSIVDNAAHGNLSGITPINNTSAKLVYTPTINFTGSDLFTFKANNGTVDSNIGTVAIVVNGTTTTNTSPIARDDFANTNEDKPILITVLANDTDSDADLLSVDSIKLQPINGTSIINSNGTVTYSPDTNFFGADGFNYTISDGKGGNATAHVSVTVNSVNDPPIISNDLATTPQDKPVVINVLANDTDPEGDALVISAITNPPSNGTAIINNNGTITFTAPTGFSGSDTFDYQVSDGNGGNSTGSVLVNVIAAVNKPPVVIIFSPINGSQFTEGDPVVLSGSATDPEDGNISSVMTWESSIDGPLGIGPNIVVSSFSQGTHSITASAIDSGQLSNSSSIEIIVHDFNDPPVAVADHFETNEDTPFNMNVIANDTDPDNDALTIAGLKQIPNNGQASINSNNTINYEPNQNFNGQDSLIYTIADGLGGNSSAQALIDVLEINDNPIARNDSTATDKNTAVLIDVLANDTDVDNDPLTISQVTTPAHGSASIENAKIKYTPNLNFVGIDEFDYTVSDGNDGNAKAYITVNVKNVNQLPVATDGSGNTDENTPLNVKLNASDLDNDPLTYIIDTQPSHGSVSGFDANIGTLTYTPQINFTGQDSLKFKVNDGTADSNIATVLISVKNVNHPPVAENQNLITNTNKQIEITLKGHDQDSGDIITFVKVTDPSHGTIAGFDKDTGKLTYIPNNGYSGPDSFLFKVIDNSNAESNIATVSITVNAIANNPPVASNVNVETTQDIAKIITLVGNDPDAGDKITYHIVSAASTGSISSIDQTTGKITYTPNRGFLGLDSFTYKVTDLSGASSNIATVGITVKSTSPTPYPLPPSCSPNDKSGGKALRGTNSDDVIIGTEAADSIQGLSGNDAINGCGASDNLNGNAGNDGIAGGTNEDNIHGNNGNDYLRGDAGNDALYGSEGDDVLVGGPGRDSFYCGSGNDKVLDFNAKEGDALQKQFNTKGRDASQKSDCENVSSISSTSTSAKSSSLALPQTPTEQISPRDDRNQSQTITTQPQQSESSVQKGQNETIQNPQNSKPIVTDYTISIDKNQRVSIILPGNDNDGDKLLFKIINKPQNALIGNFKASSGSLTYSPNKDYLGDDKFTFTANDGKTDSNIGTVIIHVKNKQIIVDQQNEPQSSGNPVKPFPPIYWRGNIDKTEKLLPLSVGNLTVESADQVTRVLRISSENHNIYENIAAQILTAKLNIKNNVNSCKKVNDVIKYGDEVLHSVNYHGVGTGIEGPSAAQMKNMIKAHSILSQFNIKGCTAISPIDMIFAPSIFEILYSDPFSLFVN